MNSNKSNTSNRKKEHLELCISEKVSFKTKTNGFENYEFKHYAITEIDINKINFQCNFFSKKINYPFLISCMTGGTDEADNINAQLAKVAENLGIPIGVGSQRQALENEDSLNSFKIVRKNAPNIPVLSNIGAAQLVQFKSVRPVQKIIDIVEADVFVIHTNPLQELLQDEGEANFKGLLKKIKDIVKRIQIPVIVKEVGSGISYEAAKELLDVGVEGIDVAGAGGTSWAGVEILRSKKSEDNYFWDWGLPTAYCIWKVSKLKKKYKFILIGSGGIGNGIEAAKALALGADIVASARPILLKLNETDANGAEESIKNMFNEIKQIMFLTGSKNLKALRNKKLIKRELLT